MTGKALIKLMLQNGWEINRIHGSHYVMKKGSQTEIVPVHNKDLAKGLLNSILKRTGLK